MTLLMALVSIQEELNRNNETVNAGGRAVGFKQQGSSGGAAVLTLAHRRTQAAVFIGFSPPYHLIRPHAYRRLVRHASSCSLSSVKWQRRQQVIRIVDHCKEMTNTP